jgi:heme A synthase
VEQSTQSQWLHRFALLVAAAGLVLIGSGAFVTSSREALTTPEVSAGATLAGAEVHQALGMVVAALAVVLAIWALAAGRGMRLRIVAVVALASGVVDAFLALHAPLAPEIAATHAGLAALFFGCLAGVVYSTAPDWNFAPEVVDDRGMRFLRPLAISAPPLVLLQIMLGALYRHKVISVMWHMAGAMVVSLVTLIACMIITQQYPAHRALRGSAIHLMSIVLLQVALGVTAFTMQLLEIENSIVLAVMTGLHVVVGNLTLAASLLFAVQVLRCVLPQKLAAVASP